METYVRVLKTEAQMKTDVEERDYKIRRMTEEVWALHEKYGPRDVQTKSAEARLKHLHQVDRSELKEEKHMRFLRRQKEDEESADLKASKINPKKRPVGRMACAKLKPVKRSKPALRYVKNKFFYKEAHLASLIL
jgi:hypothetical protein